MRACSERAVSRAFIDPSMLTLSDSTGSACCSARARAPRGCKSRRSEAECVDDVVADVPEFRVRRHVAQQRRIGGVAYVHAEDFVPVVQQTQAQVGADESHAAQYDYSPFAFSSLLPGKKQNPFHTGGNPAGSPCEVGRFALRNFCRVFRRQLAVVRSKGSYEQASAGQSCGLPIHPRRIENLPAAAARSRSFPYLLFLMSAYSVKSAFGSWSTLFIGTTSMPLGRLPPLAR